MSPRRTRPRSWCTSTADSAGRTRGSASWPGQEWLSWSSAELPCCAPHRSEDHERSNPMITRPGPTRLALLGLFVFAVLAAVLGVAPGAQSTTNGANGLIVYGQEVAPEHYQLFTIKPDGSDRQQITRGRGSALNADWAPSGRSLVYELDRATTAGVAVTSASGRGRRILTPRGFQGQPSFSPDGKWIAFERDPTRSSNGVWLIRANGTGLHQV